MKLNRTHSILVVAAICHLLADVAFAGGAVLCVGPNDHTEIHAEIEVGHVARDCGPSDQAALQAGLQDSDSPLSIGEASECVDTPLHADAEMLFEELSWDFSGDSSRHSSRYLDGLPIVSLGAARLQRRGRDLYTVQAIALTPTMRDHRSIVLIV